MILKWIIDFIYKFFKRNNVRLLEEAKLAEKEDIMEEENKFLSAELLDAKKEKSKNEKIIEILKDIGCESDIFYKNSNFDYVGIEKLKCNLNMLTSLHFDKFELSKILSQYDELLNMESEIIENSINRLREYIKDEEIIKQIIYMNPYILTERADKLINDVEDIFNEYNIDYKFQKYILDDNPNILTLEKNVIDRSLKVIKKISKNYENFIQNIVDFPIIIGMEDEILILENINE